MNLEGGKNQTPLSVSLLTNQHPIVREDTDKGSKNLEKNNSQKNTTMIVCLENQLIDFQ